MNKALLFSTYTSSRGKTNVRVFTNAEKKEYYTFTYRTQKKSYFCSRCITKKQYVTGKLEKCSNGEGSFWTNIIAHICEPFKLANEA